MIRPCTIPSIDDDVFEETVLQSSHPVLVQFIGDDRDACEAGRCPLGEISETAANGVRRYCLHTRTGNGLTARFGIGELPTILLFHHGNVARRLVGCPLPGELEVILRADFSPILFRP